MTLLVVRLLVLLIGSSTSLGSTVSLNSLVVEENLCFPLVYLYSSVCLGSVALTSPSFVVHVRSFHHPHPQTTSRRETAMHAMGSFDWSLQYLFRF